VPGELPEGYLEQYKLAVEMADRVSARRGNANTFYLAIQSALIALMGVKDVDRWAVATAGLLLSLTWFLQLRSYRQLNTAKYAVINAMEAKLPVAVFDREWSMLKKEGPKAWRERYAELGYVERLVPVAFGLVFAVLLMKAL
jgi:hypothetical protein